MASVQSAMGNTHPTAAAYSALSSQGTVGPGEIIKTKTLHNGATTVVTVTKTRDPGGQQKQKAPLTTHAPTTQSSTTTTGTYPASTMMGGSGNGAKVTGANAWKPGEEEKGSKAIDAYSCYPKNGPANADGFAPKSTWCTFSSMWETNQKLLKPACSYNKWGADNTDAQNNMIKEAIMTVAKDSLVDPRVILATIMQESKGCLVVPTTNNGKRNPGLMQSDNGVEFRGQNSNILQMVRDGTQGTSSGKGLVQLINQYGDVFSASRTYNSGEPNFNKNNLNAAYGSTTSYVNDIANRLTGWATTPMAAPTCPGES